MKRAEVRANRQKWIDYLKEPDRKKTKGSLDEGDGHRCCLGHGCFVLGVEAKPEQISEDRMLWAYGTYKERYSAPFEFMELVGLYSTVGAAGSPVMFRNKNSVEYNSLAAMNDSEDSEMSPQEIGEYLQSVIEGGPNTPFRSLSSYEE